MVTIPTLREGIPVRGLFVLWGLIVGSTGFGLIMIAVIGSPFDCYQRAGPVGVVMFGAGLAVVLGAWSLDFGGEWR